jgi:uncharacterized membrane protein
LFRTALNLYGGLEPEHAYEKDALDSMSTSTQVAVATGDAPAQATSVPRVVALPARSRIASIDVMRGLVMVIMLMDHLREAIYRHLQVGLYRVALAVFGANHGERFGVDHVWWIWVVAASLACALYFPCRAFTRFKRTSPQAWVRYF